MTTWNYRVLVHLEEDEPLLEIHEVYYNKDGQPDGYTANSVGPWGSTRKELQESLQRMNECLNKPFLWGDEKFPQIYNDI